jgi:hypothetical protein
VYGQKGTAETTEEHTAYRVGRKTEKTNSTKTGRRRQPYKPPETVRE